MIPLRHASLQRETSGTMRPPVLIVLHGELSTPGRIAIQLRNRDIPLDVRRPRFGDELPKTLEDHTGAVIFGGPQSANDDDEVVKREIDWIAVPLKEKKPYLGICLGAQMLAKHLGARVYKHRRRPCRGRLLPDPPDRRRPRALPRLARPRLSMAPRRLRPAGQGGAAGRRRFVSGAGVQLRRHLAYALQFHMDVTHATMCRWTTRGHERMTLPNAKPREAHFEDRLMHDPACRAWLSEFIDQWLKPCEAPVAAIGSHRSRLSAAPRSSRPCRAARTPSARSAPRSVRRCRRPAPPGWCRATTPSGRRGNRRAGWTS